MDSSQVLTRRTLLRTMAGGVVALGVLPLLAACGDDNDATSTPAAGANATTTAPSGTTPPAAEATTAPQTTAPAGSTGTDLSGKTVTIYSGRSEQLVQPALDMFAKATGAKVEVRYGSTSEMAALLLEEGERSPADVFFAQDAGALGAVGKADLFAQLPEATLAKVESRFASPDGEWIGVSGRARAVVYNTDKLSESDIPASILDFTDPSWKSRLGWAPTNASFQSFITALRVERGDDVAKEWLEGMLANDIATYEGNNPIVQAVVAGELDAGFVNHYYLLQAKAQSSTPLPAENYIYRNGDPGALINIAGVGVLKSGEQETANAFVDWMLGEEAQSYFAKETFEYPLVQGVSGDAGLVPLSEIQTPDINLSDLDDLEGTLEMLRDVGLL